MEEEILSGLESLRKELENLGHEVSLLSNEEPTDHEKIVACNAMNSHETDFILEKVQEGDSLEEAFNKTVRTYDDALTMCAKDGSTLNNAFIHEFTVHHVNAVLGICANLLMSESVTKNKDSIDLLKSKIRECLVYIDNL